ncbi:MAG: alginate lyase family protein [Candidatus Rokubacteria bacterium]|nr:alginate lyase family protein [Candidatus Rokubacteria bacterium]
MRERVGDAGRDPFAHPAVRLAWRARRRLGRVLAPVHRRWPGPGVVASWFGPDGPHPGKGRGRPVLRALCADPQAVRDLYRRSFPAGLAATLRRADAVATGKLEFLGFDFCREGRVRWDWDPWTDRRLPRRYWTVLGIKTQDESGEQLGDFMFPNEPNKHQYFPALAKAFFLTGDARYAQTFREHLRDWMAANPLGVGAPYVHTLLVAQRLMAWVLAWDFFAGSDALTREDRAGFVRSLYQQARFLAANCSLDWVPRNNFLLAEMAALAVVAARFPEFPGSAGWATRARRVLRQEVPRQIWPDGVSVEQSTGYQRLVTEALVLYSLAASDAGSADAEVSARLEGLLESHLILHQPDGQIPLLGDVSTERGYLLDEATEFLDGRPLLGLGAALFNRPDFKAVGGSFPEEAFWLLGPEGAARFSTLPVEPPPWTSRALPDGGYYVFRSDWSPGASQLIVDCGWTGMGPDGSGGHGHNDTLSIVVCARGRPVVADPGTYIYFGSRRWRDAFRSRLAHSTVVVDGEEGARLGPGLFEIRDQPRPVPHRWELSEDLELFEGSHTGYLRLPGGVTHRRRIVFARPDAWVIGDTVEGGGVHTVRATFQLAPGCTAVESGSGAVHLLAEGEPVAVVHPLRPVEVMTEVEEGWVSYQYGTRVPAPRLVLRIAGPLPIHLLTVLAAPSPPGLAQRALAAWEAAEARWPSIAPGAR